jgi:hypothetical protein
MIKTTIYSGEEPYGGKHEVIHDELHFAALEKGEFSLGIMDSKGMPIRKMEFDEMETQAIQRVLQNPEVIYGPQGAPGAPLSEEAPKNGSVEKPPLGVVPRKLWLEGRLKELKRTILSYTHSGYSVKIEWVEERNQILAELNRIQLDEENANKA